MRNCLNWKIALLMTFAVSMFVGCGESKEEHSDRDHDHPHAADNGHHAEEGPHGGQLIELGREHKFHAELVEDHNADSVSIYILDGKMKEYQIAEPNVTLAITAGSGAAAYELQAINPMDGKSAHFGATDEDLHKQLEHEGAEIKLRVTIDGTPYTGTMKRENHEH